MMDYSAAFKSTLSPKTALEYVTNFMETSKDFISA